MGLINASHLFRHVLRTIRLVCPALSQVNLRRALQSIRALLMLTVEMEGFEPLTPCLQGRCSPN